MSPTTGKVLSAVLVLLLLAGSGYGLFVAARTTVHAIAALNSSIAVAIIAAGVTVLVSVLSVVIAKLYESRLMIRKEQREQKIPVYEDLIKFMFRILTSTKMGAPPSDQEMVKFISGFNQRIMVWGSDEVLAAWVKWRRQAVDEEALSADPMELMFLYEELIFTIRRDLGHRNRDLMTGDVLALFVNDIDRHLPREGR